MYISGVDFGCFSTSYGDCEALEKREEQTDFTLFRCIWLLIRLEMTRFYIVHRHFVHSMNVRFLRLLPKALAFSLTERRAGDDRETNGTKERQQNVRLLRNAEFT